MRGGIKFIMTSIGLVLISIAVAALLFSPQIEAYARGRAATSIGRYYGSEAEISAMRLDPLQHGVELSGVTLYNPVPFDREPAVTCERLLLKPDWSTIFSARLELTEVAVEGAQLWLRYDVGKGTNLGMLLEKAAAREAERENTGAKRRTILVRNCHSRAAQIILTSNALLDLPFTVDIAPFEIEEISAGEPVPASKAASLFLKSVLWKTLSAEGLFQPAAERIREELGST